PAYGKERTPATHVLCIVQCRPMHRRKFLAGLAAGAVALAAAAPRGRASNGVVTSRIVMPSLASDTAAPGARSYRMGWFPVTPHPTLQSLLDTLPVAALSSDAVWL